jgi:hypothetical protein
MLRGLFLTIFLCPAPWAMSCDCVWDGDFLHLSKTSDIVVQVMVLGHEPLNGRHLEILVVKVVAVYKGRPGSDTLRLRGDDGMSCSPYVNYFKTGRNYLLQYDQVEHGAPSISNCGEYYLDLENGHVIPEKGLDASLAQTPRQAVGAFEERMREAIGGLPYLLDRKMRQQQ